MKELTEQSARPPTLWWRQNREWARPVGCLAVFLPALAITGCVGTVLTLAFGAVKLVGSLRKD